MSVRSGAAPRRGVSVQIPSPEADRPSWLRVGVVALIGFALGVAWPRLTGVRFGPSAPAEALSAVAARAAEAPSASAVPAPAAVAPAPVASASAAAAVPTITVGHSAILNCKTDDGDSLKGKDCGGLAGLDPIVQARLKRLAQAPSAAQNPGKLNVILGLDFKNNRVSVESGKSSTVKDADSLKAFIAGEMKGMSLKSVDHDNPRYSVLYIVTIAPGGETAAPAGTAASPSASPAPTPSGAAASAPSDLPEGTAAVAWEVAIVRDSPHTGAVVARLPRNAKVQLGTLEAGWYKIKYGPNFASEGWVYRGAVGK
ncbi:MAG TPA: hypothetical protein VLM85_04455 [Polyangiaceae bacterium]|nr:hypothetical protein [Polyangiaceae bacterium]